MLGDAGGVGIATVVGRTSREAWRVFGGHLGNAIRALGDAGSFSERKGGSVCWVLDVSGWQRGSFEGRVLATRAASM